MTSAISPGNHHILYTDPNPEKWEGDPDLSITGTGFSVPRGIESVLSYNGIVLNDLSVYDKYRVIGIDGLADADVRDNREDLPGDDGEDAYDSFYSGRTIVLKIRVEAYQLDKLRDMEESLRSAFVNMTEEKLHFVTGDVEKDHYINCKKSAPNTKEEDVTNIGYKHFRDWQITLRASDPRFYRTKRKSLLAEVNGENQIDPAALVNIGNYNTEPKIILYSGMNNIELHNYNAPEPFNNIKFKTDVVIAEDDYYIIDIKKRKIVDSHGNNKLSDLDKTSGWLKIFPGSNQIGLGTSTQLTEANSQILFYWKDAWV